jgi:hypothetical protein
VITILIAEVLRISFGTRAVGWDNLVYGILLVLFIIFLPKGILGSVLALRRAAPAAALIVAVALPTIVSAPEPPQTPPAGLVSIHGALLGTVQWLAKSER